MRTWLAGIAVGALLACVPVAQASTVYTQTPQSPYAGSGTGPGPLVQGDFNGDGKPDLFLGDYADGTYRVFLGVGDGTFQAVPPTAPFPRTGGTNPYIAAVGRFNGDALDDVALVHLNSPGVTVLLATGGGAFSATADSPIGTGNGRGVAVGDVNGDGHADLAWTSDAPALNVLLGDGSGRFAPGPGPLPLTGPLAIGRIDAGPTEDLALPADTPASVQVLLNDGSGRFAPAPGSPFATGTRYSGDTWIADMNGDGLGDAVVSHGSNVDNVVSVLLGSANGSLGLAPGSPFPSGVIGPVSTSPPALMGSDGKLDVVATGSQSDQIAVLQGDGSGRLTPMEGSPFATPPFSGVVFPLYSEAGDYNGDGVNDIAYVAANTADSLYVLLGRRAAIASDRSLRFADTAPGSASGAQSVRVTNTAAFPISFGGASIDGAAAGDFVRGDDTCSGQTVIAGGSCEISLRFLPSAAGARSATLTLAQDGDLLHVALAGTGATGGAGGGGGPAPAPSLTAFGISNRAFAVAGAGRARRGRHAPRRGTRFRATVAHALRLVIALERSEPGRRARGGHCVKPTRANRRARRCTRWVQAGTLTYAVRDGANALAWSGRIGRHAAKPGSYRAVATARANGRTSRARSVRFRIVRG